MEQAPRGVGTGVTRADRPTTLLSRPEPADVMALTPDGPVLGLGWRGWRWRVVSSVGPERIGAEWWRWGAERDRSEAEKTKRSARSRARNAAPPPDRDYFAVQVETGRWLWVCRQVGTGRWFVHGEWS